MKHKHLPLLLMLIWGALVIQGQNAWFNEIHYDNFSTDQDEMIEVVVEDATNYTITDFSISLYNGNGGTVYDTKTLDQFTEGITNNNFTIYYYYYPSNGIQNGAPDGMCLDYQGTVITGQFLSYEGTMTAADGPASGLTSDDIGVSEPGEVTESLQLSGTGSGYGDFTWQDPAAATPGDLNNGQTFGTYVPDPEPSNHVTDFEVDEVTYNSILISWTDAAGPDLPAAYLVKGSQVGFNDIIPPADGTPEPDGDLVLNIPYGLEEAFFNDLQGATNYYFKIWPYSNSGSYIDYKTDGSVPQSSGITSDPPLFLEFESFETGDFGDWTPISVASDKDWEVLDFGGANNTTYFAEMNGYQENEISNDWLVSPTLNMDDYSGETMEFYTQWKYGDTPDELKLKYSTDYSGGDPTAATWTNIPFNKPASEDVWESSGLLDLSSISGSNVHFAFHYLSSGTPRRWDVDEIAIAADASGPYITVLSPSAGANWQQGLAYDITWIASGTSPNLEIAVTEDASSGNPTWTVLAPSVAANSGVWTWDIPVDQPAGDDYQIRLQALDQSAEDFSGIFSVIEPPQVPELVITEIMYNPPEAGNDTLEFIEIYNNDDVSVDLQDFYFSSGVDFNFPQHTLQPDEYALVAVDSTAFFNTFGISAYQWTSGALSNGGELIEFKDNLDNIIDMVEYDDVTPWDTLADGTGPSLTLCDPSSDNSLPENWTASSTFAAINANNDTIWATPGAPGCQVAPVADFEGNPTSVQVGNNVDFTDLSLNNPTSWSWDFEGGTPATSTEENPSIQYNTAGTYDVSLTVTNQYGSDTKTITDYITVTTTPPPPVADFSGNPTTVIAGGVVNFTDESQNNPDSWSWSFEGGDPATSSDQNPMVTYNTSGTFDVSLTVTNQYGSDTKTVTDYITVIEPGDAEIVITEIMYNPPESGNDSLEFIELYNNGNNTVNLLGFYFSSGVSFTFPDVDLDPDDYLVVALNAAAMSNTFGVNTLEWTSGALSNSGEMIEIKDAVDNVIDAVEYGDGLPWPGDADGSGPSLTFCYPDMDNSLGENWFASVEFVTINAVGDSIFATPGDGCQNIGFNETMVVDEVKVYPNPADDLVQIEFEDAAMRILQIYSPLGKMVRNFTSKGRSVDVNLNNYGTGLFLIKIHDEKGTKTKKVFVK